MTARERFEKALAEKAKGKKTQMLLRPTTEIKEQIEAVAATYGQTTQAVCDALFAMALKQLGYMPTVLRGRKASKAA